MIFDLKPILHITIGTLGEPGQRVFYLQATYEEQLVTLVMEKEHAVALVAGLDDLMAELPAALSEPSVEGSLASDMKLREPIRPLFRVGQMGLAYDEGDDLVVLAVYQLVPEGEEATGFRFWGTQHQMRALRDQALLAMEGGRPVCSFCGELIDPRGHLCPRRNGHGNSPKFAL